MNDKTKKYLSTSQAAKHFGVCAGTIRKWDTQGILKSYRINGKLIGHRRFDVDSFKTNSQCTIKDTNTQFKQKHITKGAIYCRVSSSHQKDDLERQIESLQKLYPKHEIFKDVASGINFKRSNFLKLIERAIKGDFDEVVVAHKDRFTRFAFDFVEWLLLQYNVKLVVLDNVNHKSNEQELAEDLLSIIHVFSCRQNGKRKYNSSSGIEQEQIQNTQK
jgi:putative resolvase